MGLESLKSILEKREFSLSGGFKMATEDDKWGTGK